MEDYEKIISLIKKEVIPAIGCTEPIAVALCAAKAREILGAMPEHVQVFLSANVIKNAMGVGIPGTGGMIGLPIAIALGLLVGNSDYQLEVLRDVTPEAVEEGKLLIGKKIIDIKPTDNVNEKLYIEVHCKSGNNNSIAIIAGNHTDFVYLRKNESTLLDKMNSSLINTKEDEVSLNMAKVYDFSMNCPVSKIDFILESARINKAASKKSLKYKYGHAIGNTLKGDINFAIMGNTILTKVLTYSTAACDARMAGIKIPVMSNSGSGNQGIAATLPVVIFAEQNKNNREELIRALVLSHLTVIYIKQKLGRLSVLCGCVIAATGSSCGIVHLMGGKYEQVSFAVKNMIANLTGMICDGAKPSCSMKLASGVSTALLSSMLAMEQKVVTSMEGIIEDDVDQSIMNLVSIGSQGMQEADKMILDIMINKE